MLDSYKDLQAQSGLSLQFNPECISSDAAENVVFRDVAVGLKTNFQKTSQDALGKEAIKKSFVFQFSRETRC